MKSTCSVKNEQKVNAQKNSYRLTETIHGKMDKGYSEAIQEGMKLLKLSRAWEDANWSKKVMDSLTPNSMSEL